MSGLAGGAGIDSDALNWVSCMHLEEYRSEGSEDRCVVRAAKQISAIRHRIVIQDRYKCVVMLLVTGDKFTSRAQVRVALTTRLLATLLDACFKTILYDPLARQLKSLEGMNLHEGKTLFIRDEVWVRARLAAASAFGVLGVRV